MKMSVFLAIVFASHHNASSSDFVPPELRIWNGYDCNVSDYPFMVKVEIGKYSCSGTLIAPNVVLTAAHCAEYIEVYPDFITSVEIWPETNKSSRINVINYEYPKGYRYSIDDIALLILDKNICDVPLVKLPKVKYRTDYFYKQNCKKTLVIGWGTHEKGPFSENLKCVLLPTRPVRECINAYGREALNPRNSICTYSAKGEDACAGDSGGPIMCDGYQIGVISSGPRCGNQSNEDPAIFVRTDTYKKFMNQVKKKYNIKFDWW